LNDSKLPGTSSSVDHEGMQGDKRKAGTMVRICTEQG
jgi:hypothetical protein